MIIDMVTTEEAKPLDVLLIQDIKHVGAIHRISVLNALFPAQLRPSESGVSRGGSGVRVSTYSVIHSGCRGFRLFATDCVLGSGDATPSFASLAACGDSVRRAVGLEPLLLRRVFVEFAPLLVRGAVARNTAVGAVEVVARHGAFEGCCTGEQLLATASGTELMVLDG